MTDLQAAARFVAFSREAKVKPEVIAQQVRRSWPALGMVQVYREVSRGRKVAA